MTNSEQAIREFAEKWGIKQNDEPTFDPHTENPYYGYTHCVKQCLFDLTALISEHYVSKEDVNQEVERRIAERQLTDEQIRIEFPIGGTFKMKYNQEYAEQIKENQAKRLGAFWYRSRLTKPGDSQKTEGGGE